MQQLLSTEIWFWQLLFGWKFHSVTFPVDRETNKVKTESYIGVTLSSSQWCINFSSEMSTSTSSPRIGHQRHSTEMILPKFGLVKDWFFWGGRGWSFTLAWARITQRQLNYLKPAQAKSHKSWILELFCLLTGSLAGHKLSTKHHYCLYNLLRGKEPCESW